MRILEEKAHVTQNSSIWIETEDTPEQVQRMLERATPFRVAPDFEHWKDLTTESTTLSISNMLIEDFLPGRTDLRYNLRLFLSNKDKGSDLWLVSMVRAAVALLHAYPGDLLFRYFLHSPVLMRKQGRLILELRSDVWSPRHETEVLSLIDLPYEWGEIPPP